ncbi:hypothetical protein O3G_MSEX011735 [Manduca sexta]|uniref:C2 DOCK-type domain-containing protein n=1 Tax=Manduca sexta TaxID=7130 RepID=A0A921ZMJ4_MANSE|nr:hypothetical protein O3G_MSEX011735 [Manduca sexta]
MLIRKQTNKCNILPGQPNYGIVVALRLLTNSGSITEAVASGATVTAKRGFPDVIMPGDVRNDLYLTLEKAEFERGGKSTAKNVLATVSVHDNTGQVISDCVWGASGVGSTAYESLVLYHNNSPAWGEQLRLTVPLDTFTHAHVRIEFRHCSTRDKNERKLFGFAFARLMEASGATLRDGAHELYVYKCDDPTKLSGASYLSAPSCATDAARGAPVNGVVPTFQRSSKENCTISTLLCSTKLTQNEDLLALLQWRARPEKVQETLLRVLRLGDGLSCEELIKFLRDVLDALFALFSTEDGNSTPHSGTVFLVLISICSLLDESRFQHFRPVLDVYIEEHFSAALVYKLWSHLAPHPHDRKPLKDFLMRAFLVFRHLIEQDVFPPDWMVLRLQSCKVLLSALKDLAVPLQERFLGDEPPQFDAQLWVGYLELGVSLVTCGALQPERWAARAPRAAALRAAAARQVLTAWNLLGEFCVYFKCVCH